MRNSKQFVIDRIVDQAKFEGVSLTDVEIHMLGFTEATSGSKDLEATEIFERDCDDEEFERKIANLIRHAYERDMKSGNQEAWDKALTHLAGRDLYLNVMVNSAGIGEDPIGLLKDWRFLLHGIFPVALCLAAAALIGLSPIGGRLVPSDVLRFIIAVAFLVAPFILQGSKSGRVRARKSLGPNP